jgi:hypothetical protein
MAPSADRHAEESNGVVLNDVPVEGQGYRQPHELNKETSVFGIQSVESPKTSKAGRLSVIPEEGSREAAAASTSAVYGTAPQAPKHNNGDVIQRPAPVARRRGSQR